MSEAQPHLQQTPPDDGTDTPGIPVEPEPPTTKDLPDLPPPQEVGEDG